MSENTVGPLVDTAAGDIVSISVSPDGPYGVYFESDKNGNAAVISSFERLPNGNYGVLQKHGGLHLGDVLFAVNDTYLESLPHKDVINLIKDRNVLKKTFRFMNNKEYYRKKGSSNSVNNITDGKSNFLSSIRRYRISEDEYNRKYVEYEIACQLRIPGLRVQKDIVHKWILWKRYSDFEKLHNGLKQTLGWQLEGIEFPSSYTFTLNKLAPDFIELRRDELNRYWSRITSIDKVTEFTKHHCSEVLKSFLDVDETIRNGKITNPDLVDSSVDSETPPVNPPSNSNNRRSQRVQSMRRRAPVNSIKGTTPIPSNSSSENVGNVVTTSNSTSSLSSIDNPKPPPPPPSQSQSHPQPPSNNKPPPPPPPSKQTDVETTTNSSNSNGNLPPKPTGPRMNLLSQISALKKDY
eukprot:gene16969-22465_t